MTQKKQSLFSKVLSKLLTYAPLLTSASVLILAYQVYLQNEQTKEQAYAKTLNKIIEMKNWSYNREHIKESIRTNPSWFEEDNYAGYKTFDEFYSYCTLFYYIEGIYHNGDLVGSPRR